MRVGYLEVQVGECIAWFKPLHSDYAAAIERKRLQMDTLTKSGQRAAGQVLQLDCGDLQHSCTLTHQYWHIVSASPPWCHGPSPLSTFIYLFDINGLSSNIFHGDVFEKE